MEFCSLPFEEALQCATINPARQVGAQDTYGEIEIGKSADLLIIKDIESPCIDGMIIRGKLTCGGFDE